MLNIYLSESVCICKRRNWFVYFQYVSSAHISSDVKGRGVILKIGFSLKTLVWLI